MYILHVQNVCLFHSFKFVRSFISVFNAENSMNIGQGMTSREECFETKWFYMKHIEKNVYIVKYLSLEIDLTHECRTAIKTLFL